MLPGHHTAWTKGQILLHVISILAVLDATTVSTQTSPHTSPPLPAGVAPSHGISTQSSAGVPPSVAADQSTSIRQSSATSPSGPTAQALTDSGKMLSSLPKTNAPTNRNTTPVPAPKETFTTVSPEAAKSSHASMPSSHPSVPSSHPSVPSSHSSVPSSHPSVPSSHPSVPSSHPSVPSSHPSVPSSHPSVPSSHPSVPSSASTVTEPKATTQNVQTLNNATELPATSSRIEVLSSHTTSVPGSITCLGLGNFPSNSQVVCFQYEEETACETLNKTKKEELKSLLCDVINTTPQCNITIHSSEVQPKCILWVPTSRDAKDVLENETAVNQLRAKMVWGQISDHQTRSQKTMIALVTCGVLLAAFILAGYFLSNRESWSPGRQRLGEDPYCTETDSQGNTLVSVSAHAQDKPNNGTRENGTGQTVLPAATNGHSTKKHTVSDTEL
ncbi:hematopoietic progenitor cell antigen CD34 [Dendropsophus ebraccatus]|uniref:hematopoietic progenitor cell antigen CD34 n=1 Tax=Dendropsophus ebraccatus TaxID=150705 RepID=UPI0038320C5F